MHAWRLHACMCAYTCACFCYACIYLFIAIATKLYSITTQAIQASYIAMFVLIFVFISCLSFSTSEYIDGDKSCDEATNCDAVSHCIKEYSELDLYITNNKTLQRRITEAFFVTGKVASVFVRLNYNYQSFSQENDTNDTVSENEDFNCSSSQTTYIWSESVLYLLGPRPLYYLILFAENVSDVNVTIELPCLCSEVQFDLLARLTYLVSR